MPFSEQTDLYIGATKESGGKRGVCPLVRGEK